MQAFCKRIIFCLFFALFVSKPALCDPSLIEPYVKSPERVGSGRLSFFFWTVYDASLYSTHGNFSFDKPFALVIHYKMSITGREIAERSIDEMQGLGMRDSHLLRDWQMALERIIPDVDEGSVLIGIRTSLGHTVFLSSNGYLGTIRDPDFAKWFFGIWLDERTSEPSLRKQLLGQG